MLNRKNKVLKVTGKVQGVFYRVTAHEVAMKIGVTGFVMNLPDGSVLIEGEGTDEQLNQLIEWCNSGPQFAIVDEVKIIDGELKGYIDFQIRRI